MSPEFLDKGAFTTKSDIYSLGILIWEIFHMDTNPYKNITETMMLVDTSLRKVKT
jgi:serine/threonine protein kinase